MAETAGESPNYHLGWRLARYVKLLVVVYITGFLSLTKGWFSFVAVPLLLLVVPAVAWAQILTDLRLAKGTAHPSMPRWAGLQLAAVFVGYFVMPTVGDGVPVDVYIVDGPAARAVFLTLTAASAIGFLVASVKFFNASRASTAQATAIPASAEFRSGSAARNPRAEGGPPRAG